MFLLFSNLIITAKLLANSNMDKFAGEFDYA